VRRPLSTLPFLFLAPAVGLLGWTAWGMFGPDRGTQAHDGEAAGSTSTLPATTTSRPAERPESSEAVTEALIGQGHAVLDEIAELTRAVDNAQAGTRRWAAVAAAARLGLIPSLEEVLAFTEQVLATGPDTVTRIAATDFRNTVGPLLDQAEELVARVIDPATLEVDEVAWDPWWSNWLNEVQEFIALLNRSTSTAGYCGG
jgi:hypothetical protein